MNRASPRRLLFAGCVCLLSLFGLLFSNLAPTAQAAGNAGALRPWLIGQLDTATSTSLTVIGHGFTPSGKVYLALYDQAGAQLYQHHWVSALPAMTPAQAAKMTNPGQLDAVAGPGGDFTQSFAGLCAAAVMARALDETTNVWSGWLTVNSACAPAAEIADDMNASLTLPVAPPAAYAIATGILGDLPVLINVTTSGANDSSITLAGLDFTAGRRVYLAVYDQMGAKLYQTGWLTAEPQDAITGMGAVSPEAHPIAAPEKGAFVATFPRVCGASVMVRGYDQATETWSNWVEFDATC